MLVAGTYTIRATTPEHSAKRSLDLFTRWQPPSGFTFKSHYAASDGTAGRSVRTPARRDCSKRRPPSRPFFDFKIVAVVDIMAAVPVFQRVNGWRDSVK